MGSCDKKMFLVKESIKHPKTCSLKVLAALHEELNEGWVWISGFDFPSRAIIKITNCKSKKSIYCEALKIDRNFCNKYNQPHRVLIKDEPTLVISEWYRKKLGGIDTCKSDKPCNPYKFEIVERDNFCGKLMASCQHPQNIVRLASCLALISVFLGVLSLF